MNKAREYLELKGYDQTYWGNIIIEAEERNCFTEENEIDSGGWVTCACGRVTSDIPRYENKGRPQDKILNRLGDYFPITVEADEFLEAAKTLVRIEKRALRVAKAHLQEQRA